MNLPQTHMGKTRFVRRGREMAKVMQILISVNINGKKNAH